MFPKDGGWKEVPVFFINHTSHILLVVKRDKYKDIDKMIYKIYKITKRYDICNKLLLILDTKSFN